MAVARRQADDCAGAIAAFTQYSAQARLLGPYASFQVATCYQTLGDTNAALARTDELLQQTDSRRLRIEALESQAGILEKAGDAARGVFRTGLNGGS